MNDLDALARAVEAQRPDIPGELLRAQHQRLLSDPRARVRAARRAWGVVATGALALSLAAAAWFVAPREEPPAMTPAAPTARQSVLEPGPSERRLQDGTWIQLDPGALGDLAEVGTGDVRFELRRGRAQFDVTPDRGRTFRVLAGQYEVSVIGTRFSVDYDAAGGLAVSVARGAVAVVAPGRASTRLDAGDRLTVSEGGWSVERAPSALPARADAISGRGSNLPAEAAPVLDTREKKQLAPPRAGAPSPEWRRLYQAGDYAGALRVARDVGLERLARELDAAALADLADSARLGGDATAALQLLAALEQRFPDSESAARASFLSGRLLARQGRRGEAVSAFERHLARDPDGVYSGETRGRLMQAYAAAGDQRRARGLAEAYLARYPEGPYRVLASSLVAGQ